MHMPNICFIEARQAIPKKCQPRNEADAIRRFLARVQPSGQVSDADAASARVVLGKFASSIKQDLANLDSTFQTLANLPCLEVFGLDDAMLVRTTELALAGFDLDPFDQSILAGILVRASRLWDAGERTISFCETDGHLQPWDKNGNAKPPLREAFDRAHVWVYGDFTLTQPQRREDFE
jgi:hypothetical protein